MSSYEYHKVGHRNIRVSKVSKQEDELAINDSSKIQKLTRKKINIIFGYLYNLTRFNEYTTGYIESGYVYDVVDEESQIQVYYENTSGWKLPISVSGLNIIDKHSPSSVEKCPVKCPTGHVNQGFEKSALKVTRY